MDEMEGETDQDEVVEVDTSGDAVMRDVPAQGNKAEEVPIR